MTTTTRTAVLPLLLPANNHAPLPPRRHAVLVVLGSREAEQPGNRRRHAYKEGARSRADVRRCFCVICLIHFPLQAGGTKRQSHLL